jgi:hypothetical protein
MIYSFIILNELSLKVLFIDNYDSIKKNNGYLLLKYS